MKHPCYYGHRWTWSLWLKKYICRLCGEQEYPERPRRSSHTMSEEQS